MVKLLHQLPQMDSVNLGLDKDLPEHFRNSVRGLLEEYEKRVKVDQQNLSNDMGEILNLKSYIKINLNPITFHKA